MLYIYRGCIINIYICLYTLYNNVSICSCTPIHAYWYVYTWTFAYLIVQVHEGENEITEWKTRYGPRAFCIILKRHPSLYVLYMYVWLCVMTFIHNHARKSVLHDHWVFFWYYRSLFVSFAAGEGLIDSLHLQFPTGPQRFFLRNETRWTTLI